MTQSLKPNEQEEQMAGVCQTDRSSDADDKTQAEVLDLPPHGFDLFIEDRSADASGTEFNYLCDGLKSDSVGGVTGIQSHGSRGAFVKFQTKALSIEAIRKLNEENTAIGVYKLLWEKNKLRIWNVPHDWTEENLKTAMRKQVGHDNGVLLVHFMMEGYADRKTGIILFCNKSCAEKAMRKMSQPGVKLGAHAPIVNWENHEDFVVPYTIKDKESYIKFITELREKLIGSRSSSSDVVDYIFERDRAYPVIGKKAGWIFIELNAEDGENGRTITLAIRKENLYVLGFRTQEHGWYELSGSDKGLPKEYNANKLRWGVTYTGIMKLNSGDQVDKTLNFGDQVEKTLRSTRLGKAFAERAVRRLARYSELVEKDDDRPTRVGLAGLIVMICEAARMNPFLDTFAGGWNEGTGLTTRLAGIMWDWGSMSAALLRWKESGYSKWPVKCKHKLAHALASVHLVLNSINADGSDPAWVEILGVEFPPNFDATGITITVSDEGGNSHIIYKQGKREYQKKAISVYEWFRIRVEGAGVERVITKEWDCRRPEGGYATGLDTRAIFLGSTRILVTYLVMTNAIEANVEVHMWRDNLGSEYTACGKIAARFDDYEIMLFNAQKGETIPCKVTPFDELEGVAIAYTLLTLPLERSEVRMPRGKPLHITMEDLLITDASGKDIIKIHNLTFVSPSPTPEVDASVSEESEEEDESVSANEEEEYGHVSAAASGGGGVEEEDSVSEEEDESVSAKEEEDGHISAAAAVSEGEEEDDNYHVEVIITWKHYQDKTIVGEPCIIGVKEEFIRYIEKLRGMLAHEGPTGTEPHVLAKPCAAPPVRCIHIELQVGALEQRSSITLAVRVDSATGVGFMNQSGVWYDLGNRYGGPLLSQGKYKSVHLSWGPCRYYKDILQASDRTDDCIHKLNSTKLTVEGFAKAAVRTLSRYPDVDVEDGDINPRVALVGLIIMFCESAKLETIRNFFVNGWYNTMEFTPEQLRYIIHWMPTSLSLLQWMVTGDWIPVMGRYDDHESWLNNVGIKTGEDAKKEIRLVFNYIRFWRFADQLYYRKLLNYFKKSRKLLCTNTSVNP